MAGDVFFSMSDRHFGGAPHITEDTCDYHGYFEGACGDQWVFRYDRKTGRALLNGGDPDIGEGDKNGWAATIDVTSGKHGLVLDEAEAFWLASCLSACGLRKASSAVVDNAFLLSTLHNPDGTLNYKVLEQLQKEMDDGGDGLVQQTGQD